MIKSLKCIIFLIFFFFSSSVYSLDLKSYWDELDRLNGLRIYAKTGGWNFWYKNDTEYVYSDLTGSLFSGKDGIIYNYPMYGVGFRWALWKFLLVNGVVSTSRLSLGIGIGLPIPVNSLSSSITPWASADLSYTNGQIPAFTFESGIDFLFKHLFIVGVEFGYSGNRPFDNFEGWASIDYGINFGIKVK